MSGMMEMYRYGTLFEYSTVIMSLQMMVFLSLLVPSTHCVSVLFSLSLSSVIQSLTREPLHHDSMVLSMSFLV